MVAAAALDQKLPALTRLHEEAFRQIGGVPQQILYDRMKTMIEGADERGETQWNRALSACCSLFMTQRTIWFCDWTSDLPANSAIDLVAFSTVAAFSGIAVRRA